MNFSKIDPPGGLLPRGVTPIYGIQDVPFFEGTFLNGKSIFGSILWLLLNVWVNFLAWNKFLGQVFSLE